MNFKFSRYSGKFSAFGLGIIPFVGILLSAIVMYLRRPDILIEAKLWAEDGKIWYAHAHEYGALAPILWPQNGYFQTISRIVFAGALTVPLEHVPVFANAVGLLLRATLVGFLLSGRFDWVCWPARLALVIYYLLMPGLDEVHANVTNAHWYLALYALLVVIARPARSLAGKVHDYGVLAIAGLSGPFILLLLPCLIVRAAWDDEHRSEARRLLGFAAVLAAVQLAAILSTGTDTRAQAPLGASVESLVNIMGSRVVAESLVAAGPKDLTTNAMMLALGVGVLILAVSAGGWRALCVALLPALQMAAALVSPMISLDEPQWPLFMVGGGRYFVIPHLAFAALVIFALSRLRLPAWAPTSLGIIAAHLLLQGFYLEPVPGPSFATEARRYREAAPGDTVTLSISPPPWSMTLTRR